MIEKMNLYVKAPSGFKTEQYTFQEKINELVDAVNGILAAQEQYATIYSENVAPMLMPENATNSKMENVAENFTTGGRIRIDGLGDLFAENVAENGKCAKNAQDPYAEQRKWIGKLCRFWDDNFRTTKHFGILTRIDETAIVPYEAENGFWYCACEPVKPDDDIIYKGE